MKKAFIRNQQGQALIELIVFLPLMFTLYSVISGFAGAINGSINQQKISRAYFYYRVQNNSTIPKPDENETHKSWATFGMFYVGWKDYFTSSSTPVMPCYRVSIPIEGSSGDRCENEYSSEKTLYVRVGTVYGVCGATYLQSGGKVIHAPNGGLGFNSVVDTSSCLITR